MTNEEFIAKVNELIAYYINTEKAKIQDRFQYSTAGLINAKFMDIHESMNPLIEKVEEVASILEKQ